MKIKDINEQTNKQFKVEVFISRFANITLFLIDFTLLSIIGYISKSFSNGIFVSKNIILFFVILIFISVILNIAFSKFMVKLGMKIYKYWSTLLLEKIVDYDVTYETNEDHNSNFFSIISKELPNLLQQVFLFKFTILFDIFKIFILASVLLIINVNLFVVVNITIFVGIFIYLKTKNLRTTNAQKRIIYAEKLDTSIQLLIHNIEAYKYKYDGDDIIKKFWKSFDEHNYYLKKDSYLNIHVNAIVSSLFTNITTFIYVFFLLFLNDINKVQIANIVFFILIVQSYIPIVMNLTSKYATLPEVRSLIARVEIILFNQTCTNISNFTSSSILEEKLLSSPSHIKFDHVEITLENNKVIKNYSADINTYGLYLITGSNGVGKTTLMRGLTRYYNLSSGSIYINGIDINNIERKYYQKLVKYMPQHLDNSDFQLNGTKVSKGQMQMNMINQLKNSQQNIIILDEPLSSLDTLIREEAVQQIYKISRNKIVFVISHSTYFDRYCDSIISLS